MRKVIASMFMSVLVIALAVMGTPEMIFAQTRAAQTQDHIVSPTDLEKEVAKAASARQLNEARLEKVLLTPQGREAMRQANVDYATVQKGISTLSDAEVAQLAARADKAQANFAAGAITAPELLIVLIAVIVIIVIVVAV
ncbi:MAG TPA: hypothetical protein VMH00_00265 [Candidatus Limnocylindrales bacterium]|nr:hypothetical protein [Candidatus Limnocylindrales bacterium]